MVGTGKIQEELRINERRLSLAVSATGLGIYEHSINLGEDPYHSEQWATILGYELDEIPEPRSRLAWIFDRVHPEDVSLLRTSYTDFTEGRIPKFDVDVRVKHKSGNWIYIRSASEATERDRDGKVLRFIGAIQDITARKEIEIDLIRVKKHLEFAQEYAQFGSWELDLKSGIGYWSDEVFRLHHLQVKDGIPDFHTEYMDCVHPDDREEFMKSHTRNIEEKAETRMVFRTNPESGSVRYLQSNVNVILDEDDEIELLFGTCQDITERILQEKEYKELIDGMTETVWVIDLDGNLIDVNKSAVDLLGYSKKELLTIGVHGIDVS
ncbi:PAS domain-containing protein, partial [Desulfatiferula olefinivorans]